MNQPLKREDAIFNRVEADLTAHLDGKSPPRTVSQNLLVDDPVRIADPEGGKGDKKKTKRGRRRKGIGGRCPRCGEVRIPSRWHVCGDLSRGYRASPNDLCQPATGQEGLGSAVPTV